MVPSVEGETRIQRSNANESGAFNLNPIDAHPLPDALEAIAAADVITIGPGSLYTSLIPEYAG